MHRTTLVPRSILWNTLLGLVFVGVCLTGNAPAQPPSPGAILVPVGATKQVEMSKKLKISEARVENPDIVQAQRNLENPASIFITGRRAGATRIILTDEAKNVEAFDVVVPSDAEQMRMDLEKLLRNIVPTARVEVVLSGPNTFVLKGTVLSGDSVRVLLDTARNAMPGVNVVSALRIGGVQQVQIDVVIARVNRSEARNMAMSFIGGSTSQFISSTIGGAGALASTATANGASSVAALAGTPNLIYGIVNNQHSFVGYLQALRTEGLAKFLGCPKVVTLSGRPAYIVSGGETPILTSSGQGAANVTYKQFGTVVNFLPIVQDGNKIYLEVRPEVSALNQAFGITIPSANGVTSVPGFDTRSAQVAVMMEPGQTLAIGGLIQSTMNGATSKVPILGDLPFVGAAFRSVQYSETEEELLILVTPHLVDPMACNQVPKLVPGQETRSPDDFELFLEGILEAPRGPREICNGLHYTPAFRNSPSMGVFPCGGTGCGLNGSHFGSMNGCGMNGCGMNGCTLSTPTTQPMLNGTTPSLPVNAPSPMPTKMTPALPVETLPMQVTTPPMGVAAPPMPAAAPPMPAAAPPMTVAPPPMPVAPPMSTVPMNVPPPPGATTRLEITTPPARGRLEISTPPTTQAPPMSTAMAAGMDRSAPTNAPTSVTYVAPVPYVGDSPQMLPPVVESH